MIVEFALSVALLSQLPPQSAAPTDPVAADLECASLVAVSIGLSGDNPDMARMMTGGLMYYLGRLQVRDPEADWPARIENHVRERGIDSLFASANRCSTESSRAGALIPSIGEGVMRATNLPSAQPAR